MITFIVVACLVLLFGLVVFRGAPYLPTHNRTIQATLDMLDLKKGDVVVDLGSGDGAFLKAAAKRGLKAVGYELNPALCLISYLRCFGVRRQVKILWRDFWLTDLPPNTKAVFVFLAGPYMGRLSNKLQKSVKTNKSQLKIASYGFAIPGVLPHKVSQGVYLYLLKP